MPAPLISAIVPAFNSAATVEKALSSIEQQRFRDFEIIVVDDASSDETPWILRGKWQGAPDRRCIFLSANRGPAAARNRGIAEARGEWLAFLDADDLWLPWRLDVQMKAARGQPSAIMWCGGTVPFGRGGTGGNEETGEVPAQGGGNWTEEEIAGHARPVPLAEFAEHNPVATSTVLVRRDAVKNAGGFDEAFRGPEDYDLWMRLAARGAIARLDLPLSRYRSVSGSLSMDDRRFLPQVLRVVDKAYGRGGVFGGRPGKRRAKSYQCLACCWMALERGAPARACRLWMESLWWWPWPYRTRYRDLSRARIKLLASFLRSGGRRKREFEQKDNEGNERSRG
jgi:glycosyltransferase involved in cell wall biosynthesis